MTKFLFTMNMPSSQGTRNEMGQWDKLVHQVIGDYPVDSLTELMAAMLQYDGVIVRQYYKTNGRDDNGNMVWEEKDDIFLNFHHIGKIQKHVERPAEVSYRRYANPIS